MNLDKVMKLFGNKLKEELGDEKPEIGDQYVFTCNNATVIYSFILNEKGKMTLDIKIIGGQPIYIDTEFDIFDLN